MSLKRQMSQRRQKENVSEKENVSQKENVDDSQSEEMSINPLSRSSPNALVQILTMTLFNELLVLLMQNTILTSDPILTRS